ncbi:ADP-ribosylglycohydrolase family protein [Catellatospora tritici]|uniref:ADP-ribosylglycohydrolase family protein n=1 Tax=Catellatospora tritici TaxID=2851566 RepID=UPI0027DFE394|nr:ADP-ribosylglycohydrolase family protein [Catellatospora tritici]
MGHVRAASGSLFGLAYGDALGKPTEFRTYAQIVRDHGPGGPRQLPHPALVTDDTQMALAVAWALHDAAEPAPEELEPLLRERFLAWAESPENNRAPGMTCLTACANLSEGGPWQRATVAGSKGCGANMRVTPVGLIASYDLDTLGGVAQLQAAMTHGHPTALAASELTALAVRLLRDGTPLADLPEALRDHCADQRTVYRWEWLGDLWERPGATTPEDFVARGWDECATAVDVLIRQAGRRDDGGDVSALTGEGWVAEEALVTGLFAALRHPDDPVAALGRAAATNGDSDSIACLTGAFLGAAGGMAIWPATWADRIEYADQLDLLGTAWD